ncbi:ROK family protein [Kitasatospora aureofaciens]|uniref:ROK family transcriptional regulator n=1 Tax=Kitasatospora aureofaciens TaxID=1894 RepID=UPI00341089F7
MRTNNERLLLDRLRADGATSRAELARITGLSKPTVSTALSRLQSAGLVRELGKVVVPGRGRSPVLYEADPSAGHGLGVHVGRRWVRVALTDLDGRILTRHDEPNDSGDAHGAVSKVIALARRVTAEAGVRPESVLHTVIGGPGAVDENDAVRYAVGLPGWGMPGIVNRLQDELGTGLTLVNDANLAALGEYAGGVGRGRRLFMYLLVGAGVGGGIVVDGKLFPGAHGAAGELGYLPCCSATGEGSVGGNRHALLEESAAGGAVVAMAHAKGLLDFTTAKQVFDAARAGDELARTVVAEEAQRLAHGIASVAAVIDPELVVLGGGIGNSADLLIPLIRAALPRITPLRLSLAASELGDGAVLHGAVAMGAEITRELVFEKWQHAQEPLVEE